MIRRGREYQMRYIIHCIRCFPKVMHQELKNWSMRAFNWNGMLWAWPRVSAISTESVSRSQYKTSVHEESSIKLMKNASILLNSKYLTLCAWLQVTLLAENILHGVYSKFDTLFYSLLFTLAGTKLVWHKVILLAMYSRQLLAIIPVCSVSHFSDALGKGHPHHHISVTGDVVLENFYMQYDHSILCSLIPRPSYTGTDKCISQLSTLHTKSTIKRLWKIQGLGMRLHHITRDTRECRNFLAQRTSHWSAPQIRLTGSRI